jgi:tetratricopeptide (TPR) repeat protein
LVPGRLIHEHLVTNVFPFDVILSSMENDSALKIIADLFAVEQPEVVDMDRGEMPKEGRSAQESDELGAISLRDGDVKEAIRHFQKAISQRDEQDISSYINLAGAYDYGDQFPEALRQYQKALRIQQEAAEPLVGVSDLYRRYGRFRDSIERLEQAISLEPKNGFLRFKLAETLREAGERKRALTAAQHAVVASPDESFYHYWIGDLLIQMGRYDEALDSLRAAIELSPGDDFLYLRASVAFWREGRKTEAIKAVRLASDLDPKKHLYHGILEILLRNCGLEAESELETERSAQMDAYDHDTVDRLMVEMGLR